MSQNDMSLANQAGAAFRSDVNSALQALASLSSGATEPSTTYAYQWWADTTTGLLKIRNAANSGWVTVGTLATANLGIPALANITGLGANVATALAIAIGSAGAPVVLNGALGTPTSGDITNLAATQAQQETGTAVTAPVTPGRQQYHASAAKAWVMHDAAGNMNASYNMASVTDNGTGNFTPTWATDFSSATYAFALSTNLSIAGVSTFLSIQASTGGQAAGSLNYTVVNHSIVPTDPNYCYAVAYGDQA